MPVLRLTLMIAAVLVAGCVTHGQPACKAKCEPSPVANDQLKPEPSRAAPTPATAEIKTAEPSRAETKSEEPLAVVNVQPAKPASANRAPGEQAEQAKSAVAIAPAKSTQTDPSKISPKPSGSAASTPASITAAPVTPGAKVATAGNKVDAIDSKPQTPASKPAAKPKPAAEINEQTKAKPAPSAAAAKPEAAALDLAALEKRLKETKAIGVFTKLTLKNQVDDLLGRFRAYYGGQLKTTLSDLRQPYDLLMLKVITLLQDDDPALARTIDGSREAIWGILADPVRFSKY